MKQIISIRLPKYNFVVRRLTLGLLETNFIFIWNSWNVGSWKDSREKFHIYFSIVQKLQMGSCNVISCSKLDPQHCCNQSIGVCLYLDPSHSSEISKILIHYINTFPSPACFMTDRSKAQKNKTQQFWYITFCLPVMCWKSWSLSLLQTEWNTKYLT